MWQKLLSRFDFDRQAVDPVEQQKVALAVLLLECARADFEQSAVELAQVRTGLQQYFGLDPAALDRLLAAAGEQARAAVSMHEFVSHLNASLQPAEKIAILDLLWNVVYADGRLDAQEEHLLRKLADLLYVPHREFIATKLRAAERAHG